jgi:hypothetical protein
MATGVAALLGIWYARSTTGAGLLSVDYFFVPLAQILLAFACVIMLQVPRKIPRWWLSAIGFAGSSICLEIARIAMTIRVIGGLVVQGLLLLFVMTLSWLGTRGKINLESWYGTSKGVAIFGGLLYGAFAIVVMPQLSIFLLFATLVASWTLRLAIKQWVQLPSASPVVRRSFIQMIMLVLVATAAMLAFSLLAVPSPMLFLYPALAGFGILAIESFATIRQINKSIVLVKLLDIVIAVEFLAILLGST